MKKVILTVPSISTDTEKNAYIPGGASVTSIKVGENRAVKIKFGNTLYKTLYFKAVT